MSITLCRKQFHLHQILPHLEGVYAVVGSNDSFHTVYVLYVGESGDIADRFKNHEREGCWQSQGYSRLEVFIHQERDVRIRRDLEQRVRGAENPPCNKQ